MHIICMSECILCLRGVCNSVQGVTCFCDVGELWDSPCWCWKAALSAIFLSALPQVLELKDEAWDRYPRSEVVGGNRYVFILLSIYSYLYIVCSYRVCLLLFVFVCLQGCSMGWKAAVFQQWNIHSMCREFDEEHLTLP